MMTGEEYQDELNKYIRKDNYWAGLFTAFFLGLFVMVCFNITAASSMSGATQTLRAKGTVDTIDGQVYFYYSQEQSLEELRIKMRPSNKDYIEYLETVLIMNKIEFLYIPCTKYL